MELRIPSAAVGEHWKTLFRSRAALEVRENSRGRGGRGRGGGGGRAYSNDPIL